MNAYISGNLILDRLPHDVMARVRPRLDVVTVLPDDVLYAGNAQANVETIYFPITSVVSMLVLTSADDALEADTVGREGFVPFQAAAGAARPFELWRAQAHGTVAMLPINDFRRLLLNDLEIRPLLQAYAQSQVMALSTLAACNRLHGVAKRSAKRLLFSQDREETDTIALTHEDLAVLLGVRRAGVTMAMQALADAGIISYTRGSITVRNRIELEAVSCECYAATTAEYRRLMHSNFPAPDELFGSRRNGCGLN